MLLRFLRNMGFGLLGPRKPAKVNSLIGKVLLTPRQFISLTN
jgi:hypothetical protein